MVEIIGQTSHDGTSCPLLSSSYTQIIKMPKPTVCVLEEMTFPCAQNVDVMHLDFPLCLLCGFLIADGDLYICGSYWTLTY